LQPLMKFSNIGFSDARFPRRIGSCPGPRRAGAAIMAVGLPNGGRGKLVWPFYRPTQGNRYPMVYECQ
jgi:hypothetical protein